MRLAWPLSLCALVAAVAAPTTARADALCGDIPDVMILLDRSGSMKEEVGGQSKATIARSAVQQLLQQFSGQIAFGMALFPHWPHLQDCTTGQVNAGPSLASSAAIDGLLNSNFPKGNTPIAASLARVGDYLKTSSTGPRYVILVTDGKETCLSPAEPLSQPGTCSWNQGNNYRKCGGCGWQFCLSSGTWSAACEGNEDHFGCSYGQTCSFATGLCGGTPGPTSAQQAAAQLLASAGIKTYSIGFGDQVDATALTGIAVAGGTSSFYPANNLSQLNSVLSQIGGAISCCGNGKLDPGELCDPIIAAGLAGSCPTGCSDGNSCTLDYLSGAACQQKCAHSPITQPANGDGCCPPGATNLTDSDCGDPCGNGKLDAGELCDTGIATGQPGACPASCNDGFSCTTDTKVGFACQQRCDFAPVTQAQSGDGCCPPGATDANDSDCPKTALCGNGKLDAGELCDTAIAAGNSGACPTGCNDANPCTADAPSGSGCLAACRFTPIACPSTCGDGKLDPGEKCDPKIPAGQPGSCTMTCQDSDPCTRDVVAGENCDLQCSHLPMLPDLTRPDGCCPKGSTGAQDVDCLPPCTPDRAENCIDGCQGVKCPDGNYCSVGQCVPWPQNSGPALDQVAGGCDCRTAGDERSWPAATTLVLLLGLLLLRGRRRR